MELISVECHPEFSPDIVRVTVKVGTIEYSFDIPSNVYPEIGEPLGWPTNPCTGVGDG